MAACCARVKQAGPFIVSIFTAPEPLRAGPVDVSVLVQSSGGAVLTDAVVDILLESATAPDRAAASQSHARRGVEQAGEGGRRRSAGCGPVDADRFGAVQRRGGGRDVPAAGCPGRVTNEPGLAVAPRAAGVHRAVRRAPDAEASAILGAALRALRVRRQAGPWRVPYTPFHTFEEFAQCLLSLSLVSDVCSDTPLAGKGPEPFEHLVGGRAANEHEERGARPA